MTTSFKVGDIIYVCGNSGAESDNLDGYNNTQLGKFFIILSVNHDGEENYYVVEDNKENALDCFFYESEIKLAPHGKTEIYKDLLNCNLDEEI